MIYFFIGMAIFFIVIPAYQAHCYSLTTTNKEENPLSPCPWKLAKNVFMVALFGVLAMAVYTSANMP